VVGTVGPEVTDDAQIADAGVAGIVLWQVTMSLDGFIAGPDDALDWVMEYAGPNEAVSQVIRTTGAVLCGKRSYAVGRKPGQLPQARKVFGGAWSGPQFVLTHEPVDDEEDSTITFLEGDIRDAVATAAQAAAGRNVLVIGANVAAQCIEKELIDEILVHLAPVLLGEGLRFFGRHGKSIDLKRVSVAQAAHVTNLRFRVVN
jgi:dihydrofolate reductase